jgi:hypothetical protein
MAVDALQRLVDGHRADGHWRGRNDGLTNRVQIAPPGGQIHHRVGPILHRQPQLIHLLLQIRAVGGRADIGVDLAFGRNADRHRFQIGVVDVGGDDHAPPRHFIANQRYGQAFSVGHIVHLLRHDALTGVVHLRHIALSASLGDPVCTHIQFLSNSFPPPVRAGVRF